MVYQFLSTIGTHPDNEWLALKASLPTLPFYVPAHENDITSPIFYHDTAHSFMCEFLLMIPQYYDRLVQTVGMKLKPIPPDFIGKLHV